jgi:hypothetical protein
MHYLAILKRVAYEIAPAAPVTTTLLGWPEEEEDIALVATGVRLLS